MAGNFRQERLQGRANIYFYVNVAFQVVFNQSSVNDGEKPPESISRALKKIIPHAKICFMEIF